MSKGPRLHPASYCFKDGLNRGHTVRKHLCKRQLANVSMVDRMLYHRPRWTMHRMPFFFSMLNTTLQHSQGCC